MGDGAEATVLSLEHITKRFRAALALDDVTFTLRAGTVHALLGENGAGKTTLMRVAFGMLHADTGVARVRGRAIASTSEAIAAGVGMVHQHFTNVPAMTVAENVALGGRGRFDGDEARRRVEDIGRRAGLALDPDARADELSVGAQQRLEIVKALARDATILILDEPTAVLAPAESEELLRWIRGFADAGNAAIIITHKLREALAVADDVTVLRRGRVALSGAARGRTEGELAAAMVGEEPSHRESGDRESNVSGVVARLLDVRFDDQRGVQRLRDVSLDVRAGEVVGVAAVEGAGQRELLRVLARRLDASSGTVDLPEIIGFVPEDRHRDALILEFDAAENVVLRGAGRRRGLLHWRQQRARTAELIAQFDVRGGAHDGVVAALSGGNQQKLVIARELAGEPALLVAENPTRGLDIRATEAVHGMMRAVARRGGAVVVYSSDLDEVLRLAMRVVVIHDGHLRETVRDRDAVGRAMLGL
jgi:simple sugar transport system ATP-binding protein